MNATISVLRERYDQLLKQGAVLVDESDDRQDVTALFLLEHAVQDARKNANDLPHVVSQKLQFATVDKHGTVLNAGIAPHLNLRPASETEITLVTELLNESWLSDNLEQTAVNYATLEMAQSHVQEVKKTTHSRDSES